MSYKANLGYYKGQTSMLDPREVIIIQGIGIKSPWVMSLVIRCLEFNILLWYFCYKYCPPLSHTIPHTISKRLKELCLHLY